MHGDQNSKRWSINYRYFRRITFFPPSSCSISISSPNFGTSSAKTSKILIRIFSCLSWMAINLSCERANISKPDPNFSTPNSSFSKLDPNLIKPESNLSYLIINSESSSTILFSFFILIFIANIFRINSKRDKKIAWSQYQDTKIPLLKPY